jgi:hypothetical protein
MDKLRTALDKAGAVTRPAAMTDQDIDQITQLAHEASAELKANGGLPTTRSS